ncbi:restriction endonuclease [Wohlfahrtiimonas chitiniclastica]|uniref:restriction endonuclease n=1 Tax=Wohlfahrtiimonas chitiniclastica TaxID=400946 RepID=UPI001BCDBDA8|nr:restriction endonuclease [Wohlfahrtiimonas chitiniclastica]MBS7829180.1 restriction endonuclease [Wohlfahrtiimonas chitiniclastica]
MSVKPALLQGVTLPFVDLSSESFEDFVYSALVVLGKTKGFEIQNGRQPSSDEGFDCTARTINENSLVCIQCKRYSSTLQIKTVAEEIIKVSLENALHGSIVKQHYVITASTVSKNVRQALRENDFSQLKNECIKIIEAKKFQPKLLERAQENSIDSIDCVQKYIDSLDKLIVWSAVDFQNELLIVWSQLADILERNFLIERVLKDVPTPDFDLTSYLSKNIKLNFAPLYYSSAELPYHLESKNFRNYNASYSSIDELVSTLKQNKNIILAASGGSGKSSTLSMIEVALSTSDMDIEFIPVKIKLRSYSRNNIDKMIQKVLGISYGSWRSLPFKFIFLFDGLDEMLQHDTQAFFDDLESIIGKHSYICSVRNTGLSIKTKADSINLCFALLPLSYRGAFDIASQIFKDDELKSFNNDYRKKLGLIGGRFLSSPYALTLSIEYYKRYQYLPNSMEELLENWISFKIEQDQSRVEKFDIKTNQIMPSKIQEVFSLILYKVYFEKNTTVLSEDLFIEIITECFDELENTYITKMLKFNEFLDLVKQYEILSKDKDRIYSSPHLIISEYLSAQTLAKNWINYKDYQFSYAHYNIWLYCSSFITDEDKDAFFNMVFSFDMRLATEVAKKFQNGYLIKMEDALLRSEQSEKVLIRSNAVHALGILGTEKCLARLRSDEGLKDSHHSSQRLRALSENGDKKTLYNLFAENERQAQMPMKISGGSYDLWFKAPPALITDIARKRLEEWKINKAIPLCFSLRTIKLFGDVSDLDVLASIINETVSEQEFYDASSAVLSIKQNELVKILNTLIANQGKSSYWAKKILLLLNQQINIGDEFEYFIKCGSLTESELDSDQVIYSLYDLCEFLEKNYLDDQKILMLANTYKNLTFRTNFYYYQLVWRLALCGKPGAFMSIVELVYERQDAEEIHWAIGYLASLDIVNINDTLSNVIDEYFVSLSEGNDGTFMHYAQYYYKHKSKEKGLELIYQKTKDKLLALSEETITYNQYMLEDTFKYSFIFSILSYEGIIDEVDFCLEDSLKFLLISTEHTKSELRDIKFKILSKIDKKILDVYVQKVKDKDVRIYLVNYLLFNDLSENPIIFFKEYLPSFLSHHMFYPTIKVVCVKYWSDELAEIFLTNFIKFEWQDINVQMFGDYISIFLELLTPQQLLKSEEKRTKPLNPLIKRIYDIWLEDKHII